MSPEEMMKAMADAARPGPEHQKLEPLAGTWSYTGKLWMDPTKAPIELKGTIERHFILGGRFVLEKVTGTGLDGKSGFEGRGMIGYDKAQKKYTLELRISTMGTGMSSGLGTADPSGKIFTFRTEAFCPIRKMKIHGRASSASKATTATSWKAMRSLTARNEK